MRRLVVAGLGALVLGGVVYLIPWRTASGSAVEVLAREADPNRNIRQTRVLSTLDPGKPLRLSVEGAFEPPPGGGQVKLLFTSHAHYEGAISGAALDQLLARGLAATLGHRLSTSSSSTSTRPKGKSNSSSGLARIGVC